MLVDTGAARTCISSAYYNKNRTSLGPLRRPNIALVGAGDNPLEVLGITRPVLIEIDNEHHPKATIEIIVVNFPPTTYNGYLGFDMLAKAGCIIDCGKRTITTSRTTKTSAQATPSSSTQRPPDLQFPDMPPKLQQAQPYIRHQKKKNRRRINTIKKPTPVNKDTTLNLNLSLPPTQPYQTCQLNCLTPSTPHPPTHQCCQPNPTHIHHSPYPNQTHHHHQPSPCCHIGQQPPIPPPTPQPATPHLHLHHQPIPTHYTQPILPTHYQPTNPFLSPDPTNPPHNNNLVTSPCGHTNTYLHSPPQSPQHSPAPVPATPYPHPPPTLLPSTLDPPPQPDSPTPSPLPGNNSHPYLPSPPEPTTHIPNDTDPIPATTIKKITIQPFHEQAVPILRPPTSYQVFSPEKHPSYLSCIRSKPSVINTSCPFIMISNLSDKPVTLPKGLIVGDLDQGEITIPEPGSPATLPQVPGHLNHHQQQQLNNLLEEFADIFAQHPADIGHSPNTTHRIETTGHPIRQPLRRRNPAVRQQEDQHVQEMLDADIISPSSSPWSSPVVLVRKKDGSTRFCVDYRRLNDVTKKDATPLPRMDDSLDALLGSTYFTTLDLQAGYWQVPVAPEDKERLPSPPAAVNSTSLTSSHSGYVTHQPHSPD